MKINLIEYFEETIQQVPNKTAIIDGIRSITFYELAQKAKILAGCIVNANDSINKPIAVYLPKTIESVYSDLAITYSGNIYMNLDIKTPIERIGNIIELVEPIIIITNSQYLKKLPVTTQNVDIINIDDISFNEPQNIDLIFNRLSYLIDVDPYCIINTSGSTGTPKGVVLNHKSFFDFIHRSQEIFNFSNDEIIGSLSPLVFDIYTFELCLLMSNGSTMVIIPDHLSAFPISILKILQETEVSFIFWVPTIMVNIANMDLLTQINLPSLKLVWFAGEVFPTKQFNYWKNKMNHTKFANLYGPIEITLDCTYYIVEREIKDTEPIPIGHAYKNTDILILDDNNNKIISHNIEGELCVRGTSLAMGYYNNAEKTAAVFVQNPLNHSYPEIIYKTGDVVYINELEEIVFKGRKDSLIKHMGYRVELSEIEHVIINNSKLIRNGCIVYNNAKKEITLFYESDKEILPSDFKKAIGISLPKYMIPTNYINVRELQRNTNGKIDRLYYKDQINK